MTAEFPHGANLSTNGEEIEHANMEFLGVSLSFGELFPAFRPRSPGAVLGILSSLGQRKAYFLEQRMRDCKSVTTVICLFLTFDVTLAALHLPIHQCMS